MIVSAVLKPLKAMDNFKNILSCLALILVLACSSEQAKDSKNAQEGLPNLNDTEENFKFEPIIIAPEDKVTADKATEEMVFIKGGCFILGNNFAQVDEAPAHEVCVNDFYLDKYEVTQARWKKVMGFNPSKFIGDDRPVEQVTFYGVQEFAESSGGKCRIPTEAEWEYAARGHADARYFWGNMMNGE